VITCPPHLNNGLTLPCENKTSQFILVFVYSQNIIPGTSSMMWNMRFINYRENKLIVTKYVQYVGHWQEHKHASMSAIGQLCHQSATASSRATHAVNGYLLKFMWRPVYVTNKIPYSLPSVEPGAHPGVRAVWLFKSSPAAGCHYFPPDLRSPSQPKNVTVLQPVPSYTAWWLVQDCYASLSQWKLNPRPTDRESNTLKLRQCATT